MESCFWQSFLNSPFRIAATCSDTAGPHANHLLLFHTGRFSRFVSTSVFKPTRRRPLPLPRCLWEPTGIFLAYSRGQSFLSTCSAFGFAHASLRKETLVQLGKIHVCHLVSEFNLATCFLCFGLPLAVVFRFGLEVIRLLRGRPT